MTATKPAFDRDEWLAWRRQGIGSSDIAAIVGLSPWASPYSVWCEKSGRWTPDEDNDATEFGRRAEPMIAPWFAELTGYHTRKWQHRATHHRWKIARATLDALVFRTKRAAAPRGIAELKTTGWQKDWDELPAQYDAQIQWQLEVMDLDQAWLVALHGRRLAIYPIDRRPEDGRWLLDQAKQFWTKHVLADTPPPADGHTATTTALAGLRRTPGAETDISELLPVVRQLTDARANTSAARAVQTALENQIKAALGDGEVGLINGVPAAIFATHQRKGYTVEPATYRQLRITWKDAA